MCSFEAVCGELVLITFYCNFENGRPTKQAPGHINKPEM
jgi:hypothetical protein